MILRGVLDIAIAPGTRTAPGSRRPADPLAAWHDGWRSPVAPHRTIRADAVGLALAGTPRDAAPPAGAVTGDPASRRHVLGPDTVVSELLSVHAGVVRTRDGVQHALLTHRMVRQQRQR